MGNQEHNEMVAVTSNLKIGDKVHIEILIPFCKGHRVFKKGGKLTAEYYGVNYFRHSWREYGNEYRILIPSEHVKIVNIPNE